MQETRPTISLREGTPSDTEAEKKQALDNFLQAISQYPSETQAVLQTSSNGDEQQGSKPTETVRDAVAGIIDKEVWGEVTFDGTTLGRMAADPECERVHAAWLHENLATRERPSELEKARTAMASARLGVFVERYVEYSQRPV